MKSLFSLSSLISRLSSKFFWPVLIVVFAASLALVLWSGQAEKMSFKDAACSFEDKLPGCLESVPAWNEGLAFYDSALKVSGDTLQSLKALLWEHWSLEFAGAGKPAVAKNSILPLRVLESRKSGCMGLSWLAMMVAESRQIPLSVIMLPGHVFLRYGTESTTGVNLEPNREGYSYTDEEYREKYKKGPWTGLEFKPLTPTQFVGLAAFNMGNSYLDSDLRRALTWYRMAEEFFSEYPGIKANQEIAKSRLPDHL
ncbi:Transglutaminase-like superfamily protein [Fibrobacter sp. UWT2]|uniref:transglutaminase family protein n=1 Tax=Fibrobacter sp. UWT2 TaxID=1896224 RepID=UPI000922494E|nr:transglutaminase family protein [Fibrobacter sp. UWT2]SHK97160.1 Transglutaminase-like superfamily protein [Fibrobacter sp. UWT2]